MTFLCPVCGYPSLPHPPSPGTLCPCCGTRFGLSDAATSHEALRQKWIARGLSFWAESEGVPEGWSPWRQLARAGLIKGRALTTVEVRTAVAALKERGLVAEG